MENAAHPDAPVASVSSSSKAAPPTVHTAREAPPSRTSPSPTTPAVWTGRVLSGLYVLFLLGASVTPKLLRLPVAETTMAELGWPPGYAFSIGILELSCVILYLIPKTSIFGAILTMGLLGGAMATHIRVDNPLFSHVLFPIYVGLFMWGGLWLRTPQLRAVFPVLRR